MSKLREETTKAYELQKQKQKENAPNASYGYGGKFGIEKDRMDKSAVGHDYIAKVEKHMSQTDYNTGFGGKFGVQTDRVDKVSYIFYITYNCTYKYFSSYNICSI